MKRYPNLLIYLLVLVLIFIAAFRMGQKTEKTNKVIDYVLSITPTPRPPTPTPVKYKETKSKRWGINFTYPSNLIIKESSKAAEIRFEINNE